jgi:hypothetical protein
MLEIQREMVLIAEEQQARHGYAPKMVIAGFLADASKLDNGSRTVNHFRDEVLTMIAMTAGPRRLALPFTRKSVGTIECLRVSESERFTHDPELRVAAPHQLVTRRWIVGSSQVSSDPRHEAHCLAQG